MRKASLIFSALFMAALLLAGCASAAPKATPASPAAPTEQPDGAAQSPADASGADSNSLLSSIGASDAEAITSWPGGLPAEVPEFTYGALAPDLSYKMLVKGVTAYAVSYTGATQDNIDAYTNALRDKGFTVTNSGAVYSAVYPEQDGSMTMIIMMPVSQDVFMIEIMPGVKSLS